MFLVVSYDIWLTCYLNVTFWKNTENSTLLTFLNFWLFTSDLRNKKTEYNYYNNKLNTIGKYYTEIFEIKQKIANWKSAFKVSILFFELL